jgi:HEAT repeat protein
MGRRLSNNDWVERHLASPDPRVRASVVEALWGTDTFFARKSMWRCLKDQNNRVAGNALMGLHLLGEQRVIALVKEMLRDPREAFRWTAAWVMGQIAIPDFFECLVQARTDSSPGVRRAAGRALVALRHLVVAREERKEAKAARAAEPAATEPEVTIEAEKPAPDSEVQPETAEAPPEPRIAPQPQEQAKPAPPPNLPTQHRDDPPEDKGEDPDLEIQLDGRYIARR